MPDCRFFTGAIKSSRGGIVFPPRMTVFLNLDFWIAGRCFFLCLRWFAIFGVFSCGSGAAPFKFLAPHHLPDNGLLDFRAWLCLLPLRHRLNSFGVYPFLKPRLKYSASCSAASSRVHLSFFCGNALIICCALFIFFSLNCGVFSLRSPSALICGILKNFSSIQKSAMREGSSWQDGTSATHCAILQWGKPPWTPMALGASLLAPERQKAEKAWKAKKAKAAAARLKERGCRLASPARKKSQLRNQAELAGISLSEFLRRNFLGGKPLVAHTDLKNPDGTAARWRFAETQFFPWCASAMRHLICGQRWIVAFEELLKLMEKSADHFMIVKKIKNAGTPKPKEWQIGDLVDYIRNPDIRNKGEKIEHAGGLNFLTRTHVAQKLEMICLCKGNHSQQNAGKPLGILMAWGRAAADTEAGWWTCWLFS